MSNIHDDPRLTAYALNELNPSDRAAVEQQIGESVETLLEIEAIREVTGQLRAALRGPESPVALVPALTRSVSEGERISERVITNKANPISAGMAQSESLSERSPSLTLRVSESPMLAATSPSNASPHRFSGKLAVAASCLALAGAFGIVAVGERVNTSMARRGEQELLIAKSYSSGTRFELNEDGDFSDSTDGLRVLNESLAEIDNVEAEMSVRGRFTLNDSEAKSRYSEESSRPLSRKLDLAPIIAGGRPLATVPQVEVQRSFLAHQKGPTSESAPVDRFATDPRVKFGYDTAPIAEGRQKELLGKLTDSYEDAGVERSERLSKERSDYFARLRQKPGSAPHGNNWWAGLSSADAQSRVDGEVLVTKPDKSGQRNLVEISLGQDDDIEIGDELSVVRSAQGNAKYLGRIRVLKVTPDRAVGEVLTRTKTSIIAEGDRIVRLGDEAKAERELPSAEAYAAIHDNLFVSPLDQPLSTFSIDVDTAAYSNMRRFLTQGSWPPADAVRIEELVNYFSYDYAPPADAANLKSQISDLKSEKSNQPFATHLEVAACPWNAEHRLVRIGLKGKEISLDKRPVSNIVFLIDVSGSMQDPNKLPLVKAGLRRLVDQLTENDRVAIVVYAGASGLALDSTNAAQKDVILSAIENLQAGGSTNGGEGIQLAYTMARKHFIPKGTNRVILCTDGDFNVGITDQNDLTRLIEEEAKSGVFLSVLGFGMGNLKDATLEKLADKGNGNYSYIDSMREAHKVFVEQMTGTLITIAKDVKIQIEFNPAKVGAYRLIGYENRIMAAQDFHDDTKDAGEIGAGHTVTALYEIIPPDKLPAQPKQPVGDEKLKYQPSVKSPAAGQGSGVRGQGSEKKQATNQSESNRKSQITDGKSQSSELLTIKLRYKQPDADKSDLIEQPLTDEGRTFAQASPDFRFAASVASFGMILRHSPHRGNATLDAVAEIAQSSIGPDKSGYRAEFLGLVRSAKALSRLP